MSIETDVQRLEPGSVVRLYELDGSAIGFGALRFHGHNRNGTIVLAGVAYSPWPLTADGFVRSTDRPASPTLTLANLDGSITALCNMYEDLVGAKLIVRATLAKYLDAVNFGGVNPTADPNERMPEEVFFVERKVSESREAIRFELASAMNFEGVQIPRRQIVPNRCLWLTIGGYRGPYCGYAGGPVARADNTATSNPSEDRCGGLVSSCKLRFGANSPLPYGGFPAAGLARS